MNICRLLPQQCTMFFAWVVHEAQLCARKRTGEETAKHWYFSEGRDGLKTPIMHKSHMHKHNHGKNKKAALHDVVAPPAPETTASLWLRLKWLLLFSGHANPSWPWHGQFQEFGSILSADEELWMGHLRTGSRQARTAIASWMEHIRSQGSGTTPGLNGTSTHGASRGPGCPPRLQQRPWRKGLACWGGTQEQTNLKE